MSGPANGPQGARSCFPYAGSRAVARRPYATAAHATTVNRRVCYRPRSAGARLDQRVHHRSDIRQPRRGGSRNRLRRTRRGPAGQGASQAPGRESGRELRDGRRGPLPPHRPLAGLRRRQYEIAALTVEAQRTGHPLLGVQQCAEPLQGVRSHQQRPARGRRHDRAEPHAQLVEGHQGTCTRGSRKAERAGRTPPVATITGASGRLVHHQRTMRASVVAASRPGSKGCAPGTTHSGSGQAQPRSRPPGAVCPTPGTTGHCQPVAQVSAASSCACLPLRRNRSPRRLPRISRMSARSFPLNAEVHIAPRMRRITVCTRTLSLWCGFPAGRSLVRVHWSSLPKGGAWRVRGAYLSRAVRAVSLCHCANPAIRGWGATLGGRDAQVCRQVPGPYQLPLAITDYVPTAFDMTRCRTASVDIK